MAAIDRLVDSCEESLTIELGYISCVRAWLAKSNIAFTAQNDFLAAQNNFWFAAYGDKRTICAVIGEHKLSQPTFDLPLRTRCHAVDDYQVRRLVAPHRQ